MDQLKQDIISHNIVKEDNQNESSSYINILTLDACIDQ